MDKQSKRMEPNMGAQDLRSFLLLAAGAGCDCWSSALGAGTDLFLDVLAFFEGAPFDFDLLLLAGFLPEDGADLFPLLPLFFFGFAFGLSSKPSSLITSLHNGMKWIYPHIAHVSRIYICFETVWTYMLVIEWIHQGMPVARFQGDSFAAP